MRCYKKSANHILYEVVDITKTIPIKPQKKSVKKPKPSSRKLFDIYFFEEKEIGSINERKESIEKDQSLDKPIGKGNPFKRISLKENRTNTTNIQKRPRFRSYDNQKTYKQTQSKHSEKTSNPKKNYGKKSNKIGKYTNPQRSNRTEQYSSNNANYRKLAQKSNTERINPFSNRNANNRQNTYERKRETNQTMKTMKERK